MTLTLNGKVPPPPRLSDLEVKILGICGVSVGEGGQLFWGGPNIYKDTKP
jgi:hypothetical protein